MASKPFEEVEMTSDIHHTDHSDSDGDIDTRKNTWARLMPVIACGAGLFSDGYLNNVSESLRTS